MAVVQENKHVTSLLTEDDLYLFNEGSHFRLYEKLGAHPVSDSATYFAVWAPDAEYVAVMGSFNDWDKGRHPLRPRGSSGIWEGVIEGARPGDSYKYHVASRYMGYKVDKADPFAFFSETPPETGSRIWDLAYEWSDADWMATRRGHNALNGPISVYEVHFGSWRRVPEEGNRPLTYREMAPFLSEYVRDMGFTHVEFLPLMEHPFYGSWGYQTTGYFGPTSRYGTPQDFMYLIDHLHQNGIGVILDWVPSHFPSDAHGLGYFDGTHLYEHADPQQGFHPDWKSFIFNYGRKEIAAFLISSAMLWLDKYHIDGLRVDAVASMLYLDYSRKEGEWIPNTYGGRENIDAIHFLRRMNSEIYRNFPDVQTYAEESTSWPAVSKPTYLGGLGFGLKWDMGWMHDTLEYISKEPVHRKYHHNQLTFRMIYAFTENFILPLSHDEVVHGKGALLAKMPGDVWQKFANLRLLFAYQFSQPGKKLLFMGGEFGQWNEWKHDTSLEWNLLQFDPHRKLQSWVRDLNHAYRQEPALHVLDANPVGFEWVDCNDYETGVISFLRKGAGEMMLVVCNFTPVPRYNYKVGVPRGGWWREVLNSDAEIYGGGNVGNAGGRDAYWQRWHGRDFTLEVTVPPLGAVFMKPV